MRDISAHWMAKSSQLEYWDQLSQHLEFIMPKIGYVRPFRYF